MEELLKEFRQEMRDGFAGVNGRLDKLENRVGSLEGRFETLEGRFDTLEGRFDTLEGRFDTLEGRFDTLEGRFDTLSGSLSRLTTQVSANEATLNRVDAEVHRQGLLLEERHDELKLAIEAFQTAQRATNAKIDLVRDAMENRLVPLELATRAHATTLADHGRRLDQAEGRTTG